MFHTTNEPHAPVAADDAVLVGIDGSEPSTAAVRWAAQEARRLAAPLRIVHAFIWPLYHVPLGPAPGAPPGSGLRGQAEGLLAQAADAAKKSAPEIPVETRLITGAAPAVLVAQSARACMLVVGHRGLGGFLGLLLGSVGITVSAHAHCPVVVVRGNAAADGAVVVGVDGSPDSRLALETGFSEASLRQVRLLAIHAQAALRHGDLDRADLDRGEEEGPRKADLARGVRNARELVEKAAADVGARFSDVRFDVRVSDASAAAELVAASQGAQLVVVGSRGVGGLRGLVLGSTTHIVLHHAACPVLVVRTRSSA